ncbi:ankyrin repeat domain-containing protein 46 isoform X1 [Arapaima gigas]
MYVLVDDSSQSGEPLLQACADGNVVHAKRLLHAGWDANVRDHRGRTALHLATAHGHLEICRLLHKFGADMQATDCQGNTALHQCGHMNIVQFLVSSGLSVDICNHKGATPLVLARRRGVNKDTINFLEYLEEQELKTFNHAGGLKLDTLHTFEDDSSTERRSFLRHSQRSNREVLCSLRTTWHDFVEDLGFWRVLMLLVMIALLSLEHRKGR